MSEPKVAITASDLRDILMSVIQEARKPVITEKELREIAQLQEERKQNAANVKLERENRMNLRKNCSHFRRDGTCRAVYVKGSGPDSGNFMICQFCQGIIMPGVAPAKYDGEYIYDNALFNNLFQAAGAADIIE